MKKLITGMLSLCLLGSMWSVRAAQDVQLEKITKVVKDQLEVGDQYTDYYGQLHDDTLEPYWNLEWDKPGEHISVQVSQDGVIRWYSHSSDSHNRSNDNTFAPQLPKVTREQAQKAAEAFVKKVVGSEESVVFDNRDKGMQALDTNQIYFYGTLYYNGLPTPVSVNVSVRTADLSVQRYNRDVQKRVGEIPSKTPSIPTSDAAKLLKTTQSLELIYTTQASNGIASNRAELRYVPQATDEYIVDAKTGKLMNVTELMRKIAKEGSKDTGSAAENAAPADSGSNLTETEQRGIDLLKNVLSKEQLDQKMRSMKELGLSGFSMVYAGYNIEKESENVLCTLRYMKNNGKNGIYKMATVDAKTGALKSLYTSGEISEKAASDKYAGADAQKKAEAFLKQYYNERFRKSTLYRNDDAPLHITEYTFVQQVNGYPFPENQITVGINKESGMVDQFSETWADNIVFDSAEGLISEERAQDIYFGAHTVKLGYMAVPIKLDPNIFADYIKAGYSYLYEWRLGYEVQLEQYCYGVNAKTGDTIFTEQQGTVLEYRDVNAKMYPQAVALAQYGIGFYGEKLEPEKQLTQEDLVSLLMSADGYVYDPTQDGALEQLYEAAYRRGLLPRAHYSPKQTLTRTELVRMVISSTGYGKTANLPGIYKTTFADEKSIPTSELGYVAIAQGMGLVRGDERGKFNPAEAATREQAIIVLYNFMSR